MDFAHDTEPSLVMAAALLNTVRGDGGDALATVGALREFLRTHEFTGWSSTGADDLVAIHDLRDRLAEVWSARGADGVAAIVNSLLAESPQQPRLTRHGKWDWHLHFTSDDAPIPVRVRAETAMALVDLVRSGNTDRLKTCAAADCDRVLVDLSRNKSRRFCSEGNCANRTHVAAYRERRSHAEREHQSNSGTD
ncbi:CGNR zinc finger domain-containing protein [Tsukamurella soli]|uniref:CGNR zinc finger domain-containing protein n=1 Tax=Tsukamurella soli TaxID=644556 RepID=A0ABP8KAZ3_9ACTN